MRSTTVWETLKLSARSLTVLLTIFSVITYAASMILGPVMFFSTEDGLTVAARHINGIPIDVFMALTIPIPLGTSIGIIFLATWVIFVACFVFAWASRNGFPQSLKNTITQSFSFSKTNFLVAMSVIAPVLLYSTILLQQIQEARGVPTGSLTFPPQTSPYIILVNLAFAPIREEFAFRMTTIGIPVGIFLAIIFRGRGVPSSVGSRVKLILLAVLSPEYAKARVGYRTVAVDGLLRGINPLEWVLILATSVVFGLAHWLLGGGWDIGKTTTAFLAGFVFGMMFVAYGAYASILLHWFFNYYFTIFNMADSTYGGAFGSISDIVAFVNFGAGQVILVIFLFFMAFKVGTYLKQKAGRSG